tara:strand:- start:398 stop:1591 length:1194 start_codon:yes stop_codon:yes gene_type:complete
MLFIDKYRPKNESELLNIEWVKVKSFLDQPIKGKFLLVLGLPGVGKSATVTALAKDFEILVLNASMSRNKQAIQSLVGAFCSQGSLFGKKKLVLVDELDAISGRSDSGGLAELKAIVESTSVPIIATANDLNHDKFSALLRKAEVVTLTPPSWGRITEFLADVCTKEGVTFTDAQLKKIAIASQGDVRAALNDLQSSVSGDSLMDIEEFDRETRGELLQSLALIFKTKDPLIAQQALDRLDEPLLNQINYPIVYSGENSVRYWLEENVIHEYDGDAVYQALKNISFTDVLQGRIRRTGYWRFLSYVRDFLGPGVALAKTEKNTKQTPYKIIFRSPKRNPQLWWITSSTKKLVAQKVARLTHTSHQYALKELSYIKPLLLQDQDYFEWEPNELKWLNK